MNNAELIKALRYCVTESDSTDLWCEKCGYYDTDCDKLKLDAADALEASEKRIAELEAQIPKRGEWIGIEYDGYADGYPVYDVWECSECGEEHNGEEDTLPIYCPNCGADMRGDKR